jgi:hypothetical protein
MERICAAAHIGSICIHLLSKPGQDMVYIYADLHGSRKAGNLSFLKSQNPLFLSPSYSSDFMTWGAETRSIYFRTGVTDVLARLVLSSLSYGLKEEAVSGQSHHTAGKKACQPENQYQLRARSLLFPWRSIALYNSILVSSSGLQLMSIDYVIKL